MGARIAGRLARHKLLVGALILAALLSGGLYGTLIKTVTVATGNELQAITTWRSTVGDVLLAAGVELYEGDVVEPALDERLSKGMEIRVYRSFPVSIHVDGQPVSPPDSASLFSK